MKVSLWACRKRVGTEHDPTTCTGFKYVPVGEDPGPCGQVSLRSADGHTWERACGEPMDYVGDYEMEMT